MQYKIPSSHLNSSISNYQQYLVGYALLKLPVYSIGCRSRRTSGIVATNSMTQTHYN